jgi:tetratricopeptide (TPR) repeat protein
VSWRTRNRSLHPHRNRRAAEYGLEVLDRTAFLAAPAHRGKPSGAADEPEVVLEGSVRRTGNRLRVSAQLIDAVSGDHLWCEQYDRKLEDIFAIQEEIARCILESLDVGLLADGRGPLVASPTSKLDASLLYLEGRAFWHRRLAGGLEQAIERFGRAIARDPGFAMPYAGLADSLSTLGIWAFVPPRDAFPKAAALANTALTLIRLWYGHYLSVVGRMDEALVEVQRARVLDPVSPVCSANVGFTIHLAHEQSRAIDELRHVLARDPDSGIAWFYPGYALIETGRCDEAVCALERAAALTRGMPFALEGAGLARARAGRRDEARAILARTRSKAATSFVPTSAIAMLTVGLEEDDARLDALERAVNERDVMLPWLELMPCFDRLHGHPRFERVFHRLGLPMRGHRA